MRHETEFRADTGSLTRLAGLSAGTRVQTEEGDRPVEALRRGDWVLTREGCAQVLAVEARAARVAAIRVIAESVGPQMPAQDLLLGPATRLWLPRQARPAEAWRLVDGVFVTQERPRGMTLWTLVFGAPQVLTAEGVEVLV